MGEGDIRVLFDKCQERRLISAALKGCISSLTDIILACQRDVSISSVRLTNSLKIYTVGKISVYVN